MHYLCIDVRIIAELLFVGFLASRRFGTTSTRRHAAMHREAFRIVRLTHREDGAVDANLSLCRFGFYGILWGYIVDLTKLRYIMTYIYNYYYI
jgi:hypothetical protein